MTLCKASVEALLKSASVQTGILGSGSFGIVIRAVDETANPKHEVGLHCLPLYNLEMLVAGDGQLAQKSPSWYHHLKAILTAEEFPCIYIELSAVSGGYQDATSG